MVFAVLTSLSLVCLAAGITLLITSASLSRRARRFHQGMQTLLQLGSQGLEPADIAPAAWPVLVSAGWRRLRLEGDWFGSPIHADCGPRSARESQPIRGPRTVIYDIGSEPDVNLTLTLVHGATGGERRMFAEQLARVLVLLLEAAVRARTGAISAALAERARLTLYLQHDMRNLAQWVGWVCADFGDSPDPQALLNAANRLRQNAPLAQERANRLIRSLGNMPRTDDRPLMISLRDAVLKAAHLAGLQVELSGDATGWVGPGLLARALDNLLSNLAPNWRDPGAVKPALRLDTTPGTDDQPPMAQLVFFSPWPDPTTQIPPDKLFEPFASGRPGGLGLGLYQARRSLREAGGDLRAQPVTGGLHFVLTVPTRATAPEPVSVAPSNTPRPVQ